MDLSDIRDIILITIGILSWLGITGKIIAKFVSKNRQKLGRIGYIVFASLFTLFVLFYVIYFPIVYNIFNLAWVILFTMMTWAVFGVWVPLLQRQRFWNPRLAFIFYLFGTLTFVFMLVGFWIVRWPEWQTPALLTTLAVGAMIIYIVDWLYQDGKVSLNKLKALLNKVEQKCANEWRERKNDKYKGVGIILPNIKWFFDRILYEKLSLHYWLIKRRLNVEKDEEQEQHFRYVDLYVLFWLVLGIFIFFLLLFSPNLGQRSILGVIFSVLLLYRLFDIFQAWVNMFLLIENPELRDPIRNLVLAFVSYLEVIIGYSVLTFIFKSGYSYFSNTHTFQNVGDSLRYSIGVLTTIGSNWEPSTWCGYFFFYTQVIFGVLFVTVVIQRVIILIKVNAPNSH